MHRCNFQLYWSPCSLQVLIGVISKHCHLPVYCHLSRGWAERTRTHGPEQWGKLHW